MDVTSRAELSQDLMGGGGGGEKSRGEGNKDVMIDSAGVKGYLLVEVLHEREVLGL